MIAAILSVWALLAGIALLMAGNGLQGSLLGVRAVAEGFSVAVVGVVMSAYFAGFVAGSIATPRLIRRVGHIRVFGALASIASTAVLLHAVAVHPAAWGVLRALTGFCYIGLFIVAESWLNDRATNANRGQLLSVYMIAMTGAMAVGPLLLNLAPATGYGLFILASVLVSLALVPVALTGYSAPPFEQQHRLGLGELARASPLGIAGCLVNGATSGSLIWLAPLYGEEIGMSIEQISILTAAAVMGGTVLVWPVGRLSDRFDRRLVLTATAFLGSAIAALAAFFAAASPLAQIAVVAVVGGLAMPLYSLAVAHTNDHLQPRQMVAASSGLLLANGLGGMVGPAAAGGLMQAVGAGGFFWFPAAAMLGLGLFALYRMTRRAPVPSARQRDFVQMSRTSSVFAGIALRDHMDRDLAKMARR